MVAPTPINRAVTLLFAVAGGIAVGNLYWAQPLLTTIAASLGISTGSAGALVTTTQIGYAVGVLLIVPLGDAFNRRRLIPAVMVCSACALLATAAAPSYGVLLVTLAALGMTTVSGQLLVPLAGDLAGPQERGRVVGTIVAGILTGILLSRTISGFMADAFGWRSVYILAAAVTVALAIAVRQVLPDEPARQRVPYGELLTSIVALVARHRAVQASLAISAIAFGIFTLFWTGLTFLLSAPPYHYSLTRIGLVGLVGLAGALAARNVGWLHDHGYSAQGTGGGILLAILALGLAAVSESNLGGILVAVLLLDIAIQGTNVLNQTRLLTLDPAARSRLNTAYVTCNFIGGAIGSALAGLLWEKDGWAGLMAMAVALMTVAGLIWVLQRKSLTVRASA